MTSFAVALLLIVVMDEEFIRMDPLMHSAPAFQCYCFFVLSLLPCLSVALSDSQSLFPNETGTVLPVGKEVSGPDTHTHIHTPKHSETNTQTQTAHMHTHADRWDTCGHADIHADEMTDPHHCCHTHRHTLTQKSHLYYAEHQLADGGADYAATLR